MALDKAGPGITMEVYSYNPRQAGKISQVKYLLKQKGVKFTIDPHNSNCVIIEESEFKKLL